MTKQVVFVAAKQLHLAGFPFSAESLEPTLEDARFDTYVGLKSPCQMSPYLPGTHSQVQMIYQTVCVSDI